MVQGGWSKQAKQTALPTHFPPPQELPPETAEMSTRHLLAELPETRQLLAAYKAGPATPLRVTPGRKIVMMMMMRRRMTHLTVYSRDAHI